MFFDEPILDAVAKGFLLSAFGLGWIILLVRMVGLRSFSKMTTFDFVMTVAMGSLLAGASQSETWPGLLQTITAMACLFAVQYTVSGLRQKWPKFDEAVQNTPVLLMKDGVILQDALRATRVAEEDLIAKLREANAIKMSSVRAVVLETTGDVSVLHGDHVDDALFKGIGRI
ncbi:MAG: YetF domain-containing protein [Sulfitobacter sp.]